jgi:hypothetical protein
MRQFHSEKQQKLIAALLNDNSEKCILFSVQSY